MAKGLKIPVGVDQRGRAAVEKVESRNTAKILILAFSEGGDDNPFQSLGIDDRLIYGIKTSTFRGKALQAVNRILSKYSQLVRIVDGTVEFDESVEGEVQLSFKYIDLLTSREEEFITSFKR